MVSLDKLAHQGYLSLAFRGRPVTLALLAREGTQATRALMSGAPLDRVELLDRLVPREILGLLEGQMLQRAAQDPPEYGAPKAVEAPQECRALTEVTVRRVMPADSVCLQNPNLDRPAHQGSTACLDVMVKQEIQGLKDIKEAKV